MHVPPLNKAANVLNNDTKGKQGPRDIESRNFYLSRVLEASSGANTPGWLNLLRTFC